MSNQQAIASLRTLCHNCELFPKCVNEKPECFQAIELAISALQAQEAKTQLSAEGTTSDLISRKDAIDAIYKCTDIYINNLPIMIDKAETYKAISELPSAQPEREKGEWTKDCACEICGFKPWYERDIHTLSFCPNCGADMRGDVERRTDAV